MSSKPPRKALKMSPSTSSSSSPAPMRFMKINTIQFSVGLPPKYLGDEVRCAEEFLESRMGKYEEDLGGVVLAHEDVKVMARGRCDVYSPDVIFRFQAKILCFAPPQGLILNNVLVVEVFRSHIGLLYESTFPCKMIQAEIKHARLEWDSRRLCFVHRGVNDDDDDDNASNDNNEIVIRKDSVVKFRVSSIVPTDDLFSVLGTIVIER